LRALAPPMCKAPTCELQACHPTVRAGRPPCTVVHEKHDPTDSFILQFELTGGLHGPLTGVTLAVKDLFE
jgi:hypothetical protein